MNKLKLRSRLIDRVSYNERTSTLHVWLKSKRHVIHRRVSANIYQSLIEAESAGLFYHHYIAKNDGRMLAPLRWLYKVAATLIITALVFLPA